MCYMTKSGKGVESSLMSLSPPFTSELDVNVIMLDKKKSNLLRINCNNNNQNYHHPQSSQIKKDSATRGKEEEKCVAVSAEVMIAER